MNRGFWAIVVTVAVVALLSLVTACELFELHRSVSSVLWVQLAASLAALVGLFQMRKSLRQLLAELKDAHRRQASVYRRDAVTGALNRAAFIAECERAMHNRKEGSGYFLQIDLDYLKRINDSMGHAKGDAALRHAADIAHAMAPGTVFGRLGGDEFALLVAKRPYDEALGFANRYLAQLAMTFWHEGQPMNLSASIGVAPIECDISGFDELMHHADLALYESKRKGRGQATLFTQSMLSDLRHARLIERELRAAILLDELELAYQPLFRADGALHACEALVRWRHPLRGLVPPSDFVPVAERSVMIDLLGEWVLRRACRDMLDFPGLIFGVNFAPSQFKRDSVVSMVETVLGETGADPSRLVIEITESMAMSDREDVRQRLEALRRLGVKIALDDFGAGFSGFAYLQSFPVDTIKIDRAFVSKLGTSHASDVMVTALVNVAHAYRVNVVAEGIETEEQHTLAKLAGAELFQGYLLDRPMGIAALKERYAVRTQSSGPKELASSGAASHSGPGCRAHSA
ncbi:putative bifunctional diguanylate cyclase/phosphodiesterase [Jiella mangrovi]|uniref:EAL domain-containing protein n=1 Tax=Jiella mangrovi TaxID=2821407 RepID=A0ABS4BI75_9HYPH|nr:GGDEF domain-containing phosphodiesterase [Jiella mangrovi]MBP0616237.1 EAL domain-containing protein [Jiella mangrovi]